MKALPRCHPPRDDEPDTCQRECDHRHHRARNQHRCDAQLRLLELAEAVRARDEFMSIASHELKTPLTAIRGYSETMLDPELSPELVRKFADVVKVNADRLQHIVDDLVQRAFSQFALGDSKLLASATLPRSGDTVLVFQEQLQGVLETLPPREQEVLKMRFGLEDGYSLTLEEVGLYFNVTRERIRQIEAKALRRLRHPKRSRKLKDYLE